MAELLTNMRGWDVGRPRELSGRFGWRDAVSGFAAIAWITGLVVSVPCEADAQEYWLTAAETEELVRVRHYEGVPEEELERVGAEGCARLLEMLADANYADSHGRVLLGLGRCAGDGGYEAVTSWADQPRAGEIDRATFKAWQMLPFALERLAEDDERAVARLAELLDAAEAPEWTFKHHRGPRLLRLKHRAAADCLAATGHADAAAALDRAGRRTSDGSFREHLATARARHAERAANRSDRRRARGGTQR